MLQRWFVFSVLALSIIPFSAQAEGTSEYRIADTETLTIKSEINQQEHELYIRLPYKYAKSKKSYPVAILQDTNFSFPIASGMTRLMGGRDIEDLILVGISYSKDTPPQISRTRDYTPTYAPNEMGAHSPEAQKHSGKASQYIQFMEKELIPMITAKYRIDESNKIFIGHSFGGLLGAYILLVNPDLFDKYVIGSPSLWYDNGAIFRLEEEYSKKNKTMHASVFMYIGSEESNNNHKNMVEDVLRYGERLESPQYAGLSISTQVLEGASHFSAFPLLLTDALKRAAPKQKL